MSNRVLGITAGVAALAGLGFAVLALTRTLSDDPSARDAWALAAVSTSAALAVFLVTFLLSGRRQLNYLRMIQNGVSNHTSPLRQAFETSQSVAKDVKALRIATDSDLGSPTLERIDQRSTEVLTLMRMAHEEDLETTRSLAAAVIEQLLAVRDDVSEAVVEEVLAKIKPRLDMTERTLLDAQRTDTESVTAHLSEESLLVKQAIQQHYRQTEALLELRDSIDARIPPLREWAISPDTALYLADLTRDSRPGLIVEAGCGASTIVFASVLKDLGKGHVVSFEHEELYAESTNTYLERADLTDFATVVCAPLEKVEIGGDDYVWYAADAIDLEGQIDLLFVDGPPGLTHPQARYPAIHILSAHIGSGTIVLLDDTHRAVEQAIAEQWRETLDAELAYLPFEKGLGILRVGHANG